MAPNLGIYSVVVIYFKWQNVLREINEPLCNKWVNSTLVVILKDLILIGLEGNIVPNIAAKGDLPQAHPRLKPETENRRLPKPRPHPRSRGIMDGKGQKQMKKSLPKMRMDQLLSK